MSNHQPYLVNHAKALKFPWSIYHVPLINSLNQFLENIPEPQLKKVLVIGPGDFQELPILIDQGFEISILDIDERVLTRLKSVAQIKNFYLVDEHFNGYPPAESFDIVYAKEVIEHLPHPADFLRQIFSILKQGGRLWLSTPNYGFFLLPLLENTFLEVVARLSGFTRKNIHPSKFGPAKLKSALESQCFSIESLNVTPGKLAMTAVAFKK
jgi:2-polyprenyl-3-methyl-5-hydroxy-6-metoxy-1,4-benzoquinol methylase